MSEESPEQDELVRHISIEDLAPHFPSLNINSFLAEGGMGAVYRAVQQELDREIALKLISHEWSEHGKELEMFRKEARLMARLSHPNLVQIFDFGTIQELGIIYFLMEYVHGETLHSYSYRTRLTPDQTVTLMSEVATAIEYAHKKEVWHHDIKPENIMLTPEGKVKVLDFGLAKLANETIATDGERFGTPDYAAPEVYYEGMSPDAQSDIYSLGAVLYELLTGAPAGKNYAPPSQVSGCPAYLDQVVTRSLAHNPHDRFSTVGEWLTALQGPAKRSDGRLRTALRGSVQAGAVARRAPIQRTTPTQPPPPPSPEVVQPTATGNLGQRVSVAPSVGSPIPGNRPAPPAKPKSNLWIFPVVLFIGLLFGGIFLLSKHQRDKARKSIEPSVPPTFQITPPKADPEEDATPPLSKDSLVDTDPAPEQPTVPAEPAEKSPPPLSPPAPTPTGQSSLVLALKEVASISTNGASLGGPLDADQTLGVNLAKTPWTAALHFQAQRPDAGKVLVVMEVGGTNGGMGLFLTENSGSLQLVFCGKHMDGSTFGLGLPVAEGSELNVFVTHSPTPSGAAVSLRIGDQEPILKPTPTTAWLDGDLVNGFGGGAGRKLAEIGGAEVFFGAPFNFQSTNSPFTPYGGAVRYVLYQGTTN